MKCVKIKLKTIFSEAVILKRDHVFRTSWDSDTIWCIRSQFRQQITSLYIETNRYPKSYEASFLCFFLFFVCLFVFGVFFRFVCLLFLILPFVLVCVFSSPEQKVQVSFSDHIFSVVSRRRCRRPSSEPQNWYQPNMAQSILWWRGFKFVQMRGPALFQGEIKAKIVNIL